LKQKYFSVGYKEERTLEGSRTSVIFSSEPVLVIVVVSLSFSRVLIADGPREVSADKYSTNSWSRLSFDFKLQTYGGYSDGRSIHG
jgi:hypothetical protein